jgi:hypothetical protein
MYQKPVTKEAVEAVRAKIVSGVRLRPAICRTMDEFDCPHDDLAAAYEAAYPED